MCSDGLTNFVPVQSIKSVLSDDSLTLDQKVDLLINRANEGGGGDNISVIILQVVKEGIWKKIRKTFTSKS